MYQRNLDLLHYRDEGKLLPADSDSTMFYASIQEHLHKESALTQLDTWLCTYRTIILQSKTQAASKKKEKAKAIKAAKSNMTNITNSPSRLNIRQMRVLRMPGDSTLY